jgi:hypothetical protein
MHTNLFSLPSVMSWQYLWVFYCHKCIIFPSQYVVMAHPTQFSFWYNLLYQCIHLNLKHICTMEEIKSKRNSLVFMRKHRQDSSEGSYHFVLLWVPYICPSANLISQSNVGTFAVKMTPQSSNVPCHYVTINYLEKNHHYGWKFIIQLFLNTCEAGMF